MCMHVRVRSAFILYIVTHTNDHLQYTNLRDPYVQKNRKLPILNIFETDGIHTPKR